LPHCITFPLYGQDVDRYAATAYHGFESVESFYAAMSALGDIPQEDYYDNHTLGVSGKIFNVSVPLCVMHALDDPISTWKTVAATSGFMRPERLVTTGSGNLMILLTKRGGHVGWPRGWLSHRWQWEFMSEAVAGFASAVGKAKQEHQLREHFAQDSVSR
jgi:predicted alpha/beta-fold hydrolase